MKKILQITLCSIFLIITGCSSDNKEDNIAQVPQFVDKEVTKEKDDGWVAHLYIQIEKKDKTSKQLENNYDLDNIMNVYYDCINLRYQSLDGYSIKVVNEDGKQTEEMKEVIPTYSRAVDKQKDIQKLNNFLSEKKYNREITLNDLKEIDCDSLDKKEIVEMYNEAINKKMDEYPGNVSYGANKEIGSGEISLSDSGKLYVAYIVSMDKIAAINIEYIDSDGQYLSSLYDQGDVNEKQKEFKFLLDKIEHQIIETQSIEIKEDTDIVPKFNENLNELLTKIIIVEKVE